MLLIDANIFLELMLDQARADECAAFLESVREGTQQGVLTDLTLDSILIVMEAKKRGPNELSRFLISLATYNGLRLYWLSVTDRLRATSRMRRQGLDFEDSTMIEAYRKMGLAAIVSFDKDFDGIQGIKRLEPREVPGRPSHS